MPEYRQDPVTGRFVIIAPERAGRPNEYPKVPRRRREGVCPFCAGNEKYTPECVAMYGEASDGDPWQVRVVANKYPAVDCTTKIEPNGSHWFEPSPAAGKHEVVVESPRHLASIGQVRDRVVELTMQVYRDRCLALREISGIKYVHIFKNVGSDAGASIEHSHTQIVALPEVPPGVAAEWEGSKSYRDRIGKNVFSELLAVERSAGDRIVAESDHLIAFCPYASRFPFEVWIMRSDGPAPVFESTTNEVLAELAHLTKRVVRAGEEMLNRPAYNYWIHNSPFDSGPTDHYQWHLEFIPRVSTPAGFEWGTGMHINPVLPEEAAAQYRVALR